jgi:hypothetical protein
VEEFLNSFFPILILIAVVAFRMVSMVKRRKRKQEQKTDRGFNPWANNPPPSPGPAAAVLHTEQAPTQEEEFSAWNLSVDEDTPPKPAPVPPRPEPRPTEIRLTVLSEQLPAETPAPVAELLENYAPEVVKADIPGEASPDTPNPVVNRIRSLPSLQQGIIWAEILGTPKGL